MGPHPHISPTEVADVKDKADALRLAAITLVLLYIVLLLEHVR